MRQNKDVIRLSDHFTAGRLWRYAFPSVVMMIFTSIYTVVDGLFISNIVGKTAFAAVNLLIPALEIFGAAGYVFGTGGSALVSKELGEGRTAEASRTFSLMVYTTIAVGLIVSVAASIVLRPLILWLGADAGMLREALVYGRILVPALPLIMLQFMFQVFFVTAERPKLGLAVTVIAGVANMILDALFMAGFHWGVRGAAAATAISQGIGGLVPLVYFAKTQTAAIHLGRTRLNWRKIGKAASNGLSEFMGTVSLSVVSICYNFQLLRFAGENGVAAYGAVMYVNFIFLSIFLGFGTGTAPITSYHYGAGNKAELHSLLKKSLTIVGVTGLILLAAAEIFASPLTRLFVGYDPKLYALTVHGFRIYSIAYLLSGFNLFASSFFTALNNGFVSAAISFLRTLVFETGCVWILPVFFGLQGIWFSIVVAEILALLVSVGFLTKNQKRYGY
jgi:putative MATE family efflux protein